MILYSDSGHQSILPLVNITAERVATPWANDRVYASLAQNLVSNLRRLASVCVRLALSVQTSHNVAPSTDPRALRILLTDHTQSSAIHRISSFPTVDRLLERRLRHLSLGSARPISKHWLLTMSNTRRKMMLRPCRRHIDEFGKHGPCTRPETR